MRTGIVALLTLFLLSSTALAADYSKTPTSPLETKNLAWLSNKEGADILCMEFNQLYTPKINTIDEGTPRLYFDLPNTTKWEAKSKYKVDSKILKSVRTSHDKKRKRARVVMDLAPQFDYAVRMSVAEQEKTFCIGIIITGEHSRAAKKK